MSIGFGRAVFKSAGVGGKEEVRTVYEGFGALGQQNRGGNSVSELWREGRLKRVDSWC